MWLPTPIYERLPLLLLTVGLILIAAATYLGTAYSLFYFYFSVGAFCCVWSFCILMWRVEARLKKLEAQQQSLEEPGQDEQAST